MEKKDYVSPVVFTATKSSSSVGVFTNGDDTYVVQVCKMVGRAAYEFKVNGKASSGVSRLCPLESWEDLADWLGATLLKVDAKWLNKQYGKDLIKPYKESLKAVKQ